MPVTQGQIIEALEHTPGSSEAIRFTYRNLGLSVRVPVGDCKRQYASYGARVKNMFAEARLADGDQVEIFDTRLTWPLGKYRRLQR